MSFSQDPMWNSPFEAMMRINAEFMGDEAQNYCHRSIKFMIYDLTTQRQDKKTEELFALLNHFFFECKKFRIDRQVLFLKPIIETRSGCPIALAILYGHLAQALGLHVTMAALPVHSILKYDGPPRALYIDIGQNGKFLSEEELLQVIHHQSEDLLTRDFPKAVFNYLSYLAETFRRSSQVEDLHRTLNLLLSLHPENTRFLAERALLRKHLGLLKEALQDLKRYFSFTDRHHAAQEILSAYEELTHS